MDCKNQVGHVYGIIFTVIIAIIFMILFFVWLAKYNNCEKKPIPQCPLSPISYPPITNQY